jgi:hypothetical protein
MWWGRCEQESSVVDDESEAWRPGSSAAPDTRGDQPRDASSIARWARRFVAAIRASKRPDPLRPGERLAPEEAELAHRELKRHLAKIGIRIDERKAARRRRR